MAPEQVDMIIKRIDRLENNQRDDIGRVHDKIEIMQRMGCAQYPHHAESMRDHDARLRVCERYIYRQAGQVAVIGGLSGLLTVALIAIGRFLLTRINGGG